MKVGIFGDSHFAAVKQAVDQGLVDTSGVDLEFWGHAGKRFRSLYFGEGAIRSRDPEAAKKFATVNKHGRLHFPVSDFDCIIFVAARLNLMNLFLFEAKSAIDGTFVSSGLRRRVVDDHLNRLLGYNIARQAAAENEAKIIFSAKSFSTFDTKKPEKARTPFHSQITPAMRQDTWGYVSELMREQGIHLVPQRDETVVEGIFSSSEFGIDDFAAKNDFDHKNAAYGAITLQDALNCAKSLQH